MTDTVESTANVSASEGQPTQPNAGALQDSQNSLTDVNAVAAKLDSIAARIEKIERSVQSTKDKRLSTHEEQINQILQILKPQTEEAQSQTIANTPQGTAPVAHVATPAQNNQVGKPMLTDEANAVLLKAFGLDSSDPAVSAIANLDPASAILEYQKIVNRRNEPPNPAALTPVTGTVVNKDALVAEIAELQKQDPFDRSGRQRELKKQVGWI